MQIFDEIRSRGVEEIFFISMDGVSEMFPYLSKDPDDFFCTDRLHLS